MPTVGEIEQALFSLAPKEGAMDWDNVGLLAGRPDREVHLVISALDVTDEVIREAADSGAELIVAHHPVVFHGQKSLTDRDVAGRRLLALAEGGVAAICMHTNLDVASGGVNDTLAVRLGLKDVYQLNSGLVRVGVLEGPMPLSDFAAMTGKALGCGGVRYADGGKPVYCVGVAGGACSEFQEDVIHAGCDTFVTGDLHYHQFVDARSNGINLVDAGHFPTEDPVIDQVMAYLRRSFPGLEVRRSAVHKELIHYIL